MQLAQKPKRERRLPNAGLSAYQDQPARAVEGFSRRVAQTLEFACATDERSVVVKSDDTKFLHLGQTTCSLCGVDRTIPFRLRLR